jgi:hypothetical protein
VLLSLSPSLGFVVPVSRWPHQLQILTDPLANTTQLLWVLCSARIMQPASLGRSHCRNSIRFGRYLPWRKQCDPNLRRTRAENESDRSQTRGGAQSRRLGVQNTIALLALNAKPADVAPALAQLGRSVIYNSKRPPETAADTAFIVSATSCRALISARSYSRERLVSVILWNFTNERVTMTPRARLKGWIERKSLLRDVYMNEMNSSKENDSLKIEFA